MVTVPQKKQTYSQTNKQKRQRDISVERISFVFFFSIYSIHLLHLDTNNVLQRVKWGKKTHWRNSSKIQQKNHRNRQNHSVHYNIFNMVVGYNLFWYRYICFILWPTSRNCRRGAVKNETLQQKRWFRFSHCEFSINM